MKYSIKKIFQLCNKVGPGYPGLARLVIRDQYIGFPKEEYNFGLTDFEFHTVNSAPTFHRVNCQTLTDCSLQKLLYRQQKAGT
jgi:hypothetical protein